MANSHEGMTSSLKAMVVWEMGCFLIYRDNIAIYLNLSLRCHYCDYDVGPKLMRDCWEYDDGWVGIVGHALRLVNGGRSLKPNPGYLSTLNFLKIVCRSMICFGPLDCKMGLQDDQWLMFNDFSSWLFMDIVRRFSMQEYI